MIKHTWITIDFNDEATYHSVLGESSEFLSLVINFITQANLVLRHKPNCPGGCELTRHSHYHRKGLNGLTIWRVQCKHCGAVFTVLPHFVLPYRSTKPEIAERNLLGYYRGLSLDSAEQVCGGMTAASLFSLICALGQVPPVDILTKAGLPLPDYFEADEKHSSCEGSPLYLTTVTADRIIWSLSCCTDKSEQAFEEGYGMFQQSALAHQPNWQPKGILCDGYKATMNALHSLFPSTPIGNCVRHALNGLKNILGKTTEGVQDFFLLFWLLFEGRGEGLMPVFSLGQRLRRFAEKVEKERGIDIANQVRQWIERKKSGWFALMRDPNIPLTSVALDQRHNMLDRKLFAMKDFHHADIDRQAFLNGLIMLHDFIPYMRRSKYPQQSPVEVTGAKMPTQNWFLNLRIFSSGGFV